MNDIKQERYKTIAHGQKELLDFIKANAEQLTIAQIKKVATIKVVENRATEIDYAEGNEVLCNLTKIELAGDKVLVFFSEKSAMTGSTSDYCVEMDTKGVMRKI